MDIEAMEIYVGGLPEIRKRPFEYKAPFSPVDVIEEYTRPARMLENGFIVAKPALSDAEYMEFEGVVRWRLLILTGFVPSYSQCRISKTRRKKHCAIQGISL